MAPDSLFSVLLTLLVSQGALDEWDPDRMVQYSPGTACLVLTAPHGGTERPAGIADRRAHGCGGGGASCYWNASCPDSPCRALLLGDPNSREIATAVRDILAEDGLRPHLVASHIDRMKVDLNRGGQHLSEGVQDDPGARRVYGSYHGFVRRARDAVRAKCGGRGLLVDIHGQHHAQNWTEIGYLLSTSQLNASDYPATNTSIRGLISRSGGDARRFIVGRGSFGSILNGFGYRVVPSTSVPAPEAGGYYAGGFTTQEYGSRDGGEFDAIQVEVTQAVFNAGPEVRRRFGQHLAASIGIFARENGYT